MPDKKERALKALPSKVILPDGVSAVLDSLPQKDREAVLRRICRNTSRNLSAYYASRPAEWAAFVSVMSRDER